MKGRAEGGLATGKNATAPDAAAAPESGGSASPTALLVRRTQAKPVS